MGRPYSLDLRERVVAAVEKGGMSRRRAAEIDHEPGGRDDWVNAVAGLAGLFKDPMLVAPKLVAPVIVYGPALGSQFDHPGFGGGY